MNPVLLLVIVASAIWKSAECHRDGAPPSACQHMTPHHSENGQNIEPQKGKCPCDLIITKVSESNFIMKIQAPKGGSFRGFFIQMRNATNIEEIIKGKFKESPGSKYVACGESKNSLTHKDNEPKEQVIAEWSCQQKYVGSAKFRTTYVENYHQFYINCDSEEISINCTGDDSKENAEISTPAVSSTTDSTVKDIWYDNCGKSVGCFGMPNDCIQKKSCHVLVSYYFIENENKFSFELVGSLSGNDGWIAVGFSTSGKMAPALVTECVILNKTQVAVRKSWNYNSPRKGNSVLDETNGVSIGDVTYKDGIMVCNWKMDHLITAENSTFNFINNSYTLLLGKGPMRENGVKGFHNEKIASEDTVNLKITQVIAGASDILLKLHGTLMTIAWIGFISISIFIARHYKDVWDRYMLCNKKIWFTLHFGLNILSVLLTIIAFVVIFIYKDGWSGIELNPHPVLGCIVMALTIIQPLLALFRPHPTAATRPIFNFGHFLTGNGAHILAVINIFFASNLSLMNDLPKAFLWVTVTFAVVYCLAHILMELYKILCSQNKDETLAITKTKFTVNNYEEELNSQRETVKTVFLGIYVVLIIGLVITLVSLIILN